MSETLKDVIIAVVSAGIPEYFWLYYGSENQKNNGG